MKKKIFKLSALLLVIALFQNCSKTEYRPVTTQQSQGSSIINSSGLKLDSVGSTGFYQFIASDGTSAGVSNISTSPGNSFGFGSYTGNVFQQWQITQVTAASFSIRNVGSNLYLQSYTYNGKEVLVQGPYNGSGAQLWNLSATGVKAYKAINKADGLAITASTNALLQLQPFTNASAQIWGYNVISIATGIVERKATVYFNADEPGDRPGRVDQLADPTNASKWSYVAANADGYGTSFIDMNTFNVNGNVGQLAAIAHYFTHKNIYFSADATNGIPGTPYKNNDSTNRAWITQLISAGFNVTTTDIFNGNPGNSISPINKINTLKTFPANTRPCRIGGGPWTFGGDLNRNINDNTNLRNMIGNTDGMALDMPLGFWINNQGQIREGTLTATTYVHSVGKKMSVVLSPSPFFGTDPTYDVTQYLPVAKTYVQYLEDHNQWMDEWDVFPYASLGLAVFPETITVNGQVAPASTQTGVANYMIKHLNTLPTFNVSTGTVPSNVTVVNSNTAANISIATGSNRSYTLPIKLTNANDPQIDITPLIAASITGATADWKVTLTTSIGNNYDITGAAFAGGFWSVGNFRLTNTNSYTLNVNISALKTNSQPINISLVTAANFANTANKIRYGINVKTQ